jgi:hypothetical protein
MIKTSTDPSTSIWTTDRAHRNGQRKSSGMSAGGKAALSTFVILVVVVLAVLGL